MKQQNKAGTVFLLRQIYCSVRSPLGALVVVGGARRRLLFSLFSIVKFSQRENVILCVLCVCKSEEKKSPPSLCKRPGRVEERQREREREKSGSVCVVSLVWPDAIRPMPKPVENHNRCSALLL